MVLYSSHMNFFKLLFLLLLVGVPQSCVLLATTYSASAHYLDILGELEGFAEGTTGGKRTGPVVVANKSQRRRQRQLTRSCFSFGTRLDCFRAGAKR